MNSYHFDVGNSNEGPLGMCLRVKAETEKDAVKAANKYLASMSAGHELPLANSEEFPDIEYAEVYFNAEGGLTVKDIDDSESVA